MASREDISPDLKHITVRGAKLAYTITGQADHDNLVLVHSNISDLRTWNSIVPLLESDFRVINYSRRYHWPNDPIPDNAADPWEEHAEDLAVLIETLNLAPAHVYGNSSSATVALILAHRRPDLVKVLILEEPPLTTLFLPNLPPSILDILRLLWLHPRSFFTIMFFGATVVAPTTKAFEKGDDDAALACFCKGVLGSDFKTRTTPERYQQMEDNLKPHRALLLHEGLPIVLDEDVRRVRMPVLVLTGQKTVTAHKHINRRLTALLPDAEEVVIADAAHLVHEDQPEAVARAVLQFIARARPRLT